MLRSAFSPSAWASRYLRVRRTLKSIPVFRSERNLKISECPELQYKSFPEALFEYLWLTWKQCHYIGYWNHNRDTYFRFDLDLNNGRRVADYVFMGEFNPVMKALNRASYDSWALFNNKLATSALFERLGIPIAGFYGQVAREKSDLYLYREDRFERLDTHLLGNNLQVICKPSSSYGGQGVFKLESDAGALRVNGSEASYPDVERRIEGLFILEDYIDQHETMAALNRTSVNTLRIMTARSTEGEIECIGALLRIGRTGAVVDNGSAGGLCVAVDEHGRCGAVAKLMAGGYRTFDCHPDTGLRFEGLSIPFFNDARTMVLNAHRKLGPVHSLGWDVAITPTGPCIVEVNADWHTSLMQIVLGPGRFVFESYFVPQYMLAAPG